MMITSSVDTYGNAGLHKITIESVLNKHLGEI